MTTAVLTASDLVSSIGSVTQTGGNVEDTLDDASDATLLQLARTATAEATAAMSLGTFTLGTGRLKSWSVTYRRVWGSGSQPALRVFLGTVSVPNNFGLIPQTLDLPPTSFATTTTAAQVPPDLTQVLLDDLAVVFTCEPGTSGAMSVSEMSVNVVYAVTPTANITYPTGSPTLTTTSNPTVTWTHTVNSDGGPQSQYEIKVFTAAQYGAGGFNPDTSTPAYTSGIVTSNATSAVVGPLANSTTFKVYLRTAQTINGASHWSGWDNEIVSTNFTPANVSSVTTVADPANGAITVTANHSGAAWVDVEIERTDDAEVTWVPVRGATKTTATNDFVTAWSSSAVVARDYEAPNGTAVTYRGRASTALVTGAWTSSSATSWTSQPGVVWMKDPHVPSRNLTIDVQEFANPTTPITQGLFNVIGAGFVTAVTDVYKGGVGSFVVQTKSKLTAQLFAAAYKASPVKLVQFPASHDWESKYVMFGSVQESHFDPSFDTFYRAWQVPYTQIDRPADQTDY